MFYTSTNITSIYTYIRIQLIFTCLCFALKYSYILVLLACVLTRVSTLYFILQGTSTYNIYKIFIQPTYTFLEVESQYLIFYVFTYIYIIQYIYDIYVIGLYISLYCVLYLAMYEDISFVCSHTYCELYIVYIYILSADAFG